MSLPTQIQVYGGNHSPWVQAVLLGVYDKRIPHTVRTVPPLTVFLNSGIMMPAAKFDQAPWVLDSGRILECIGFEDGSQADKDALKRVFLNGARERTESIWKFWYSWSHLREHSPSVLGRLWGHLRRTFSVFYFFTILTLLRRRLSPRSASQLASQFSYWEERLATGSPFLGGDSPQIIDLQLFGQVQMFASIPGLSLAVLQDAPDLDCLRAWISRMQTRFEGYEHLYSAPFFEPRGMEPEKAPRFERAFYWLSCLCIWLVFPITLAVTLFYVARVNRLNLR